MLRVLLALPSLPFGMSCSICWVQDKHYVQIYFVLLLLHATLQLFSMRVNIRMWTV